MLFQSLILILLSKPRSVYFIVMNVTLCVCERAATLLSLNNMLQCPRQLTDKMTTLGHRRNICYKSILPACTITLENAFLHLFCSLTLLSAVNTLQQQDSNTHFKFKIKKKMSSYACCQSLKYAGTHCYVVQPLFFKPQMLVWHP